VLGTKSEIVRFIAGFDEINKTLYFTRFSHFGATGRRRGAVHFFSPVKYANFANLLMVSSNPVHSAVN